MSSKIIRVGDIAFDASTGDFAASVTLAASTGPEFRRVRVPGHRMWSPDQIIAALKNAPELRR